MDVRLSQEKDSLTSITQTQIKRVISSAIFERVNPEIQSIIGNLPLDQNGTLAGTSVYD